MAGGVRFALGARRVDSEAVGLEQERVEGEGVGRFGGCGEVGGGGGCGHCRCGLELERWSVWFVLERKESPRWSLLAWRG